jgi:hypothetical protein
MAFLQAISLLALVDAALSVDLASYALPFVRAGPILDVLQAETDEQQ